MLSSFPNMFSYRTNWRLSTNRFTQTLEELRRAGTPLLDLTVSNPTQCGLQYDTQTILSAFQNPEALSYDPQPKGLLSAREAVVRYYLDDHRIAVDPESVFLTTSTSEAYSFIFRLLCDPLDEVLVPKPSYPLFDFLAELHDVALIPYWLRYAQGWIVDFQSIEQALTDRTRAILLVHPNNPTGSHLQPEEMERLNAICRDSQIALIVDEVFLDYPFDSAARKSFAGNQEVLTFTLSGLSKISALPQMKVAWLACTGPNELVQGAVDRLEVIADTYLSLNAPTQFAIPTLFAQRHSTQKQLLERVGKNRAELASQLSAKKACELLESEGGWYAVLRIPVDQSDEERAIKLIREQRVVVHPGHFFDFPKDGSLVVSLITRPTDFSQGVQRLLASF
ncbi:MAG TPA: pyridoxal phosphate-dependent aminotransferase [Candidatus Acidoferrum sp.]